MAFDDKSFYRLLRSTGMVREQARLQAFLDANKASDAEQVAAGVDYTPEQVRLAIVHIRQDVPLVYWELSKLTAVCKGIRFFLLLVLLLMILERVWPNIHQPF